MNKKQREEAIEWALKKKHNEELAENLLVIGVIVIVVLLVSAMMLSGMWIIWGSNDSVSDMWALSICFSALFWAVVLYISFFRGFGP